MRKVWRYRTFLTTVLMLGEMFTNLDRQVLGLALQPIKTEMNLSDAQLGVLTGISFALFFSLLGFPLARLADRGDRVRLISITTAVCSLAVSLCGAAASFGQLLLIRIGVAVGEAGFIPAANSLIAEYFPKEERPRAISTYLLGGALAVIVGYFAGGWLIEYFGWRKTFFIMGAPGALVAVLSWFGLREPRRNSAGRVESRSLTVASVESCGGYNESSLRGTIATMLRSVTFRQLLYSYAVMSFFDYGRGQWYPAFFMRSFSIRSGDLGTALAVVYGVSGFVGLYLGGRLATRFTPNNEQVQLRLIAVAYVVIGALSSLVSMTNSLYAALALSGVGSVIGAMTTAPFFAILLELVPVRMRAQSTAFTFLIANLIGMGIGPWAAGLMSDALQPRYGQESIRYALLVLCSGYFWCAWHTWRGGDSVAHDLAEADHPSGENAQDPSNTAPAKFTCSDGGNSGSLRTAGTEVRS